jgi:hypothetical protein
VQAAVEAVTPAVEALFTAPAVTEAPVQGEAPAVWVALAADFPETVVSEALVAALAVLEVPGCDREDTVAMAMVGAEAPFL